MDALTVVAAVSALAASFAAWNSYRAVRIAHAAFVYGEPAVKSRSAYSDGGGGGVGQVPSHIVVRLHNDGPGLALNVRFRLEGERGWASDVVPPARAMQGGEALPPLEYDEARYELPCPPSLDSEWAVVTRFSDSRSVEWETRNSRNPPDARFRFRRLWGYRLGIGAQW